MSKDKKLVNTDASTKGKERETPLEPSKEEGKFKRWMRDLGDKFKKRDKGNPKGEGKRTKSEEERM